MSKTNHKQFPSEKNTKKKVTEKGMPDRKYGGGRENPGREGGEAGGRRGVRGRTGDAGSFR